MLNTCIQIRLNGADMSCASDCTLAELLVECHLSSKRVAVERNSTIVPKSQYGNVVIEAGDHIEVITAIGGG